MTPFTEIAVLMTVALVAALVAGAAIAHYYRGEGFKVGYEASWDRGYQHGLWGHKNKRKADQANAE